jgi:hypothetical protein
LLTDHQLLHSLHEGCGAGSGLWNPFFQLPDMEQVRSQLRVIAATFTLDLLDDELGVAPHKQLSDPKGQSSA